MSNPKSMLRDAEAALAQAEAAVAEWTAVVLALRRVVGAELSPPAIARPATTTKPLASMSGPDAAEAVIREAGEALHLKEIVSRIQARGFQPKSDPARLYGQLYTGMIRQKRRFVSLGKARFALAETGTAA